MQTCDAKFKFFIHAFYLSSSFLDYRQHEGAMNGFEKAAAVPLFHSLDVGAKL